MTREEFIKHAETEIDDIFRSQRNRIMNLVMQGWAEGKKNAEIDGVTRIVRDALNRLDLAERANEIKVRVDGEALAGALKRLDLTEHDPAVNGSLEEWTAGEETH